VLILSTLIAEMPCAKVDRGSSAKATVGGNVLLGPTAVYLDDKNNYARDREPVENFFEGARLLLPENRIVRSSTSLLRYQD